MREQIDFSDLIEEERGWSYISVGAAVVLLLIWAWLMVVLLSAALG